ncbi:hypothetical protein [Shewanella halifaxensis]|uniref:hypothetical protein n=1 Tax=Shewanella halifaxensis TaxID=271098 RepID=UPI00167F9204|nr:hypothetical protein [Shewanella halifaxensis]
MLSKYCITAVITFSGGLYHLVLIGKKITTINMPMSQKNNILDNLGNSKYHVVKPDNASQIQKHIKSGLISNNIGKKELPLSAGAAL